VQDSRGTPQEKNTRGSYVADIVSAGAMQCKPYETGECAVETALQGAFSLWLLGLGAGVVDIRYSWV